MDPAENTSREGRRPSAGLRRGSKFRDESESCWHSSSCRIPSSSYSYSIQQQDRYLHRIAQQQCSTYLYERLQVKDVRTLPTSPRADLLPIIQVTRENRRTSISSLLRFTRTVSTDSIDSLERRCIRELKAKQIMEAERPRLFNQNSISLSHSQQHIMRRQLSCSSRQDKNPNELVTQQSLTTTGPRLQSIGRSKTDPGNQTAENESVSAPKDGFQCIQVQTTNSRHSPPSLSLPNDCARKSDMSTKRSTPDLVLDGALKSRVLSEVIGLSVYQQRLLVQCWPNIYSTGMNAVFGTNLYPAFCKRNTKAKQLMQKADGVAVFANSEMDCTAIHTKLTLELIDSIIRNLDSQPRSIIAYLNEVGQCHKNLKSEGVTAAMWDDFGDALLDGVRKNDLVRKHKELRRAWLSLIAFITDNIKQAQAMFRSSPSVELAEIRLC